MKTYLDYTKLDNAICDHLTYKGGHATNSSALEDLAATITGGVPWRLIDRRMQAMRKSGRIEFNRKGSARKHGWIVNQQGAK